MASNITIDNLTIDEGIPGLKIGTLSSGTAVGTFSIANLPVSNGSTVEVFSLKGNDLYFSDEWIADFELSTVNHFPSLGYWWAYYLNPQIQFTDSHSGEVTTKNFSLIINDLDENIALTNITIYKNILGPKVAKITDYDEKFNETTLGYNNSHEFFEIAGDYLKLKNQYYFDGENIMDSLTGIAHQITSLPDLKVNVKGGISFEESMSYGDTVFSGSQLKETLFDSLNIKNIDESIIKIIPQVFATHTFGETIGVVSILDESINAEQILFKTSNPIFEIAKTIHNDDADVADTFTHELRFKEKFFFDETQIKDFQGNSFTLTESQNLFAPSEFIDKFFSPENYVSASSLTSFNHSPVVVSHPFDTSSNSNIFEYIFQAFDVDNQSERFPTDPAEILVSGTSIASSETLLEKVKLIASEKGTPAFAALIGDENGVIEFGMSGIRSIETDIPIFLADRFLLASNTKSMTGFIVAKFVDEGKLAWDSTIPELFSNISNIHSGFNKVTMKDLMDHTSGIPFLTKHAAPNEEDIVKQRAGFAEKIFTNAPEVEDYSYYYSNVNQTLAASALENISGKSWEALMQEYIFTPFGMLDSGFGPATIPGIDQPARHDLNPESDVYKQVQALLNPLDPTENYNQLPEGITALSNADLKVEKGGLNPQLWGPAARATMSIWDWAKYATAVLNYGNLGASSMKLNSWKDYVTPETGTYSGGWGTYWLDTDGIPLYLGHIGAVGGWVSSIDVNFYDGFYVIGMSNEGYVPSHPELINYLKENHSEKFNSDYAFDVSAAIKSDPIAYSAVQIPNWLSFDSTTGVLTGTPSLNNLGTYTVKLKATDPSGANVVETIMLKVANDKSIEIIETNETYQGTDEIDRLWGSDKNEKIHGLGGDDYLNTGSGNDTIDGGAGDDIIEGGLGDDKLIGGLGADTFKYFKGDGNDTILDFNSKFDKIKYDGFSDLEISNFIETVFERGQREISFGDGSYLTLEDVNSFDVSTVCLTRGSSKISGADVAMSDGTNSFSYKSADDGSVSGALTAGSASTVTASLAYSNSTKAVSSQDALDALKLSVGMTTAAGTKTAFDFISADFNQDGKVSSQDALSILKYSVGLPTTEQAKWVFVDTNGDYSGVSKSNTSYTEGVNIADLSADTSVSLTGILIGDVNDSYSGLIA